MSDREALLALYAPEPEPFDQVRRQPGDYEEWDTWNALRIEAIRYVEDCLLPPCRA